MDPILTGTVSYFLCCKHLLKFYNLFAWTLEVTVAWWWLHCLNALLTLCECFNQFHTDPCVVYVMVCTWFWHTHLNFLDWLLTLVICWMYSVNVIICKKGKGVKHYRKFTQDTNQKFNIDELVEDLLDLMYSP